MLIDMHTHVWPDPIAERAIGGRDHGLEGFGDGKISGLTDSMNAAGIDRSVIFGIGERGEHLERANAFVGEQDRTRFIPFGSVHVDLPPERNRELLDRYEIRGIKVHPLFQGFALDDPRLLAILAEVGDRPVIAHVGQGGTPEANARCTPATAVRLAEQLPGLNFIACHFGGYRELEEAEAALVGLPIMLETSWPPRIADLDPDRLHRLIDRHGAGRVLFGSDWPMADQGAEVAAIRAVGLDPEDEAAVLGGNAAELLGLGAEQSGKVGGG